MNANSSEPTPEERTRVIGADSSLGARLRQTREARGVSLRDISDQTRISRRYLEAIEADNYKQLPGGIFNRSFVKAYARAIGFDEDEAVAAYVKASRESGESDEVVTSRPHSRIYTDGDSTRSPLVTILLSALILAILSLAVFAGLHWYKRRSENRVVQPAARTTNPANATQNGALPVSPNTTTAPASTSAPAANGLKVQIRAKGEPVWMRTRVDEGQSTESTLKADQSEDFTPNNSLSLQYSKSKANALEVMINGRPAVVPTDAKGKPLVEMVITREDYEQLLQRP